MATKKNEELQVEQLTAENTFLREELESLDGLISLLVHNFKGASSTLLLLFDSYESGSVHRDELIALLPQLRKDVNANLQVIRDVEVWFRTRRNDHSFSSEKIYAAELLAHLRGKFQPKLQQKDLRFIFQGEESTIVRTDRDIISLIFERILDNAIKYSYPGGVIYFEIIHQDGGVRFKVEDQGMGMNEKQLKSVFSFDVPVFRGTHNEKGAGLSLKIVKNFVSLINGKISIESVKGAGTTVMVFLPWLENEMEYAKRPSDTGG